MMIHYITEVSSLHTWWSCWKGNRKEIIKSCKN